MRLPPSRLARNKSLTGWRVKSAAGQMCKVGQTAAQTQCIPAKHHWDSAGAPKKPKFISSNKQNVAQNEAAIYEMEKLAQAGDFEALQAHPGTGSPKVDQYKQALLGHLKKPQEAALLDNILATQNQPKPPEPTPVLDSLLAMNQPAPENDEDLLANMLVAQTAQAQALLAPQPLLASAPAGFDPEQMLATIATATGYSLDQLKKLLSADADIKNPQAAEARAKVASYLLENDAAKGNAILSLQHDAAAVQQKIKALTVGNAAKPMQEFADTPLYDLSVMSSITQKNHSVSGEAVCNMKDRSITCGADTRSGSYRHELGHALHAAFGGAAGWKGDNAMMTAIEEEYAKVKAKVKANPKGLHQKMDHEWYEDNYGVVGKRGLDNHLENAAEHYRLYHRELYRDKEEGGTKHLDKYRERHPGWAKIWDSHYSVALLAQHLSKPMAVAAPAPKKKPKPDITPLKGTIKGPYQT